MDDQHPKKPFFSKRVLLSIAGLAISTGMVFAGKMTDSAWVFSLAVILAGHHASDIVKAWKGG